MSNWFLGLFGLWDIDVPLCMKRWPFNGTSYSNFSDLAVAQKIRYNRHRPAISGWGYSNTRLPIAKTFSRKTFCRVDNE